MVTIRSKEELLAARKRKWDEELGLLAGVFVIPNSDKHDSGWMCMDFVAELKDENKSLVRFGGGCDAVDFDGTHFKMDCTYPDGVVHIWNKNGFYVSFDASTIYFAERPWWNEPFI